MQDQDVDWFDMSDGKKAVAQRKTSAYVGEDVAKEVDDAPNNRRISFPKDFWIIGSGCGSMVSGKRFGKICFATL